MTEHISLYCFCFRNKKLWFLVPAFIYFAIYESICDV
jgi:hypothetical protein